MLRDQTKNASPDDPVHSRNEESNDLLGRMTRHTMLEALLVSPQDGTRETSRCFKDAQPRIVPCENQCTQALESTPYNRNQILTRAEST